MFFSTSTHIQHQPPAPIPEYLASDNTGHFPWPHCGSHIFFYSRVITFELISLIPSCLFLQMLHASGRAAILKCKFNMATPIPKPPLFFPYTSNSNTLLLASKGGPARLFALISYPSFSPLPPGFMSMLNSCCPGLSHRLRSTWDNALVESGLNSSWFYLSLSTNSTYSERLSLQQSFNLSTSLR